MTQAKFPMMLDEERAKYVAREIKYEQEINLLRQQLDDSQTQVTLLREYFTRIVRQQETIGQAGGSAWTTAEQALAATEPK